VILSLKFDVINNVKTEMIGEHRQYRFPFTIVGETTLGEPELFAVKQPHVLHARILKEVRDLLTLEFLEEVVGSNSESSSGTGQDKEAGPAIGGPDRQDVQGENRGSGPVQCTVAANSVSGVNYGQQNSTSAPADRIVAPDIS
jgi:hypothetical protein